VSIGAVFATLVWLAASVGFSIYSATSGGTTRRTRAHPVVAGAEPRSHPPDQLDGPLAAPLISSAAPAASVLTRSEALPASSFTVSAALAA
jgi:hypothetical protein